MSNLKLRFNNYVSKIISDDVYNYNNNNIVRQSILNRIIIKLDFNQQVCIMNLPKQITESIK